MSRAGRIDRLGGGDAALESRNPPRRRPDRRPGGRRWVARDGRGAPRRRGCCGRCRERGRRDRRRRRRCGARLAAACREQGSGRQEDQQARDDDGQSGLGHGRQCGGRRVSAASPPPACHPASREVRHPDPVVHVARWRRGDRPDAGPDRPPGRRHRRRLDLGHGPLLPDPRRRPGRGPDARGLDDPRLPRRADDEGPPRPDGRRGPLPAAGPLGEGGDDARRPVGRAGLARDRGGLERGRVAEPRLPLPAARRPLRDARGDAPDRPRDVDRRARHGGARSTVASTTRRG